MKKFLYLGIISLLIMTFNNTVLGVVNKSSINKQWLMGQVSDSTAPAQPVESAAPLAAEPARAGELIEGEEGDVGPHVDPREVQNTLRQIKRELLPQINRLIKQIKKKGGFEGELAQLNELIGKLNQVAVVLSNNASSNEDLRDALDEFYQENYWDDFNKIRTKIELPRELKDYTRSLAKVKKLVVSKRVQKAAQALGLNLSNIQQLITELEQKLQAVQNALQSGDIETAAENMQEIREENEHPGGVEGLLHRFSGIVEMWRGVKDQNVINQVKALLQPLIDSFNTGNYRELHDDFNDVENDIRRLINNALKKPRTKPTQSNLFNSFWR